MSKLDHWISRIFGIVFLSGGFILLVYLIVFDKADPDSYKLGLGAILVAICLIGLGLVLRKMPNISALNIGK